VASGYLDWINSGPDFSLEVSSIAHTSHIPADKECNIMRMHDQKKTSCRMSAPTRAKKITVDIPRPLYEAAEEVTAERHITTSDFVREAMERYLDDIRSAKLQRELEEGYIANARLGDQIHKEFDFVDAEQA
jgi:Arc/MetJ-type ribon-helix-helix transcriptional regulator